MLNNKNDINGVFLNIIIRLYNDINLNNKLLALLYNDGSYKERVLPRLLSFRKYLLK